MAKNDRPISALIIDDKPDYCDALAGSARAEQILLQSATNLEDGIQLLKDNKKIEFVILDGKCFVDGDQEVTGSTSNNIPHRAKVFIDEINRDQNREVGYCVNTGFVDDLQESFDGIFQVFDKDKSSTELFNHIKLTASASETRKLKRLYNQPFQVFDNGIINIDKEMLLVNLLNRLESNNYDKDGFNVGREILEEIFLALINNYECIPDECLKPDGRPNLQSCSIFMGSKGKKTNLIIGLNTYPNPFDIPNHISWTFGYLKENLSELSHTYSYDWNKYTFISASNGILEVLAWLPKFIKENF